MLDISVGGSGLDRFDILARRLQSLEKPLGEIGSYLEAKAKLRFQRQQDPDGNGWAPLAPSTLRRKKTKAILRESGALAASITSRVSGTTVRVGPSVDHAIYHQLGTKKMPARRIMGFEANDQNAIGQILESYLDG